jgi:hypothetical protein
VAEIYPHNRAVCGFFGSPILDFSRLRRSLVVCAARLRRCLLHRLVKPFAPLYTHSPTHFYFYSLHSATHSTHTCLFIQSLSLTYYLLTHSLSPTHALTPSPLLTHSVYALTHFTHSSTPPTPSLTHSPCNPLYDKLSNISVSSSLSYSW